MSLKSCIPLPLSYRLIAYAIIGQSASNESKSVPLPAVLISLSGDWPNRMPTVSYQWGKCKGARSFGTMYTIAWKYVHHLLAVGLLKPSYEDSSAAEASSSSLVIDLVSWNYGDDVFSVGTCSPAKSARSLRLFLLGVADATLDRCGRGDLLNAWQIVWNKSFTSQAVLFELLGQS